MIDINFFKPLYKKDINKKLVLLVMDGLGGLPNESGKTTLEASNHPNLDKLAKEGILGLSHPISPGITPGSGPSHLALFGYDAVKNNIGRGILEALGIGLEVGEKDLCVRGNFATLDKNGNVIDRRAGRIPTEKNIELCEKLKKINKIEDVEVIIKNGKEHRFVLIFRGEDLSEDITDNDPQGVNIPPKEIIPLTDKAKKTARIIKEYINQAKEILKDQEKANYMLLRGFAKYPKLPSMEEAFGLTSCAIATYPMYRGLAKLVGMEILNTGETIESEFKTLKENWEKFDFFYIHIKKTDSYGEDGNYEAKKKIIEEVDKFVPQILELKPEVIVVTCDHSTPAKLKNHSWHPSPVLLWAKDTCLPDEREYFGERECMKGGLGVINHRDIVPLMLAHALRLKKYGA